MFLVVFGVYVWTAPQTVTLEDSGNFIMAANSLGVAHPPGYPLYTLLGKLFITLIPFGSVAYRVHLLSACCGAGACAVLWWIARRLTGSKSAAYVAGIGFGLSEVFWSQAIIAEVYTLNALFVLGMLAGVVRLVYRDGAEVRSADPLDASSPGPSDTRILALCAILAGLALANHWPLTVLSGPMLICIAWPRWRDILKSAWWTIPLVLLCAAIPYTFLVLRSLQEPEISFYGPIDSLRKICFFISRKGYAELEDTPSAGWLDRGMFVLFFLRQCAAQFTWLGAALAVVGIATQWTRRRASHATSASSDASLRGAGAEVSPALPGGRLLAVGRWFANPRHGLALGLLVGFFCNSILLILRLDMDYDFLQRGTFRVFPLMSYAVMALWLAVGMEHTRAWLEDRTAKEEKLRSSTFNIGYSIFCSSLLTLIFLFNYPRNNRRHDTYAMDFATAILDSLEKNAVLFTFADLDIGPLGYANRIEGIRPDVATYNSKSLVFSNRLFVPTKSIPIQKEAILKFVDSTDRPISYIADFPHPYGTESFGLFTTIVKGKDSTHQAFSTRIPLLEFVDSIEAQKGHTDMWTIHHRNTTLFKFGKVLGPLVMYYPDPEKVARFRESLNKVTRYWYGRMGTIQSLNKHADPKLLWEWSEEAVGLGDDTVLKKDLARLYALKAHICNRMKDARAMASNLEKSIEIYPSPRNLSVRNLMEVSVNLRDRARYEQLKAKYGRYPELRKRVKELDAVWGGL